MEHMDVEHGHAAKPRILLVEDDPVSCAFLLAAAETLPADVDAADSLAVARAFAASREYDLWLIDANLPDGTGVELLQQLRRHASTPAIAHTAAHDASEIDPLIAAGFGEVLVKPFAASTLIAALRRALDAPMVAIDATPDPACDKLPVWDDEAALAAMNGNREHLLALRRLFLDELGLQRDAVFAALEVNDPLSVQAQLHRLRASCGFVGAARLATAVTQLRVQGHSLAARERFAHAIADILESVA